MVVPNVTYATIATIATAERISAYSVMVCPLSPRCIAIAETLLSTSVPPSVTVSSRMSNRHATGLCLQNKYCSVHNLAPDQRDGPICVMILKASEPPCFRSIHTVFVAEPNVTLPHLKRSRPLSTVSKEHRKRSRGRGDSSFMETDGALRCAGSPLSRPVKPWAPSDPTHLRARTGRLSSASRPPDAKRRLPATAYAPTPGWPLPRRRSKL